jgi:PAS domain S-box-containing protein
MFINRCSSTPGFIIVSFIILIPMGILAYLINSDLDKKINIFTLEKAGLKYISAINPLLQQLPQHRGMSVVLLNGDKSFRHKILLKQNKIDYLFAQFLKLNNPFANEQNIKKQTEVIKTQWKKLKTQVFSHSAKETFTIQTKLLHKIIDLMSYVAHTSDLILDSRFESHLLMLTLKDIPVLADVMGQVRAISSGGAVKGANSRQDKSQLIIKLDQIKGIVKKINHHFMIIYKNNPEIKEKLHKYDLQISQSADDFLHLIQLQIIDAKVINLSVNDLFSKSTLPIDSIFDTYDVILPILDEILSKRIYETRQTQIITLSLIIISVLLVLYVSISFYKTLKRFKTTLDMTKDSIFMFTPDSFKLSYTNQQAAKELDYQQHALLNMTVLDIDRNYSEDSFKKLITPLLNKKQKSIVYETSFWHKTGTQIPVEVSLQYIEPKGEPARFIAVVRNITESKLLQEQMQLRTLKLRQSQESFEFAVDGAGDGIWDWDASTNEVQFSRLYMEMLGYQKDELPHHLNTWISLLHPDGAEQAQQHIMDYVQGKIETYSTELRLHCKDGSYKWILCRGKAVERDKNGIATRIIGIHTDINKQKNTEQNLIDARAEAESANRAKSEFLSSMSHELRTPMNAIMGFSQLLTIDSTPLNQSQQENVDEITKAGNHLLKLINEILDLAKVESGHIELSIETVFLSEVIDESLNLIAPLAHKRGIDISLACNGTEVNILQLKQLNNMVRADYTRLKQVFLNLLSNAVKYNCDNGKINISCNNVDNNQLRINISDTGSGLSTEQQSDLFKAFNRLGLENSELEGTGIGLVITKKILELMGGNIGVSSKLDKGSTFWIELPCDNLSLTVENEMDKKVNLDQKLTINQELQHTILYIEDNPANLRLVSQLLGRLPNIHLWSAPEPLLGLELAMEHKPDLILLDINLPGMNGFEVLKELQQREETSNTPVIAVSANAMPKDIKKGMNAGFIEYITKPIDLKSLLQAVESVLQNNN